MALNFNKLKDSIGSGLQKAKSAAQKASDAVNEKINDTAEKVSQKATETAQKIAENEKVQNAVNKTTTAVQNAKEKIDDTAQKIAQNEQVQNVMAKTSQLMQNTKEKWNEAANAAKVKMAAISQSVAESEAFRKSVEQYQRIRQNEKVVMAVDKLNEVMADERTQKILAATSKAAQKTGQITKKGLKVISGVQAVQDRKRSLKNRADADALKAEIEKTNEAIRDDLNDTLEDFGSYRMMALKNTVGLFLEYLERMNQKSKIKEYEFLTELDFQKEELAEMKEVDMKASDAMKTLTIGAGFATFGYAGASKLIISKVVKKGVALTGKKLTELHGAARTKATLAYIGRQLFGKGMKAGSAALGVVSATASVGLVVASIGVLASSFYSQKATESEEYLAEIKQWAAETEQSWIVLDGLKSRVLELQNVTEELEQRAIVELADLEPYVDSFDPNDKTQVKEFQEAAIMVKSMSELAQTPILDEDGNFNENAKIVMAKTEKIINKEL